MILMEARDESVFSGAWNVSCPVVKIDLLIRVGTAGRIASTNRKGLVEAERGTRDWL